MGWQRWLYNSSANVLPRALVGVPPPRGAEVGSALALDCGDPDLGWRSARSQPSGSPKKCQNVKKFWGRYKIFLGQI